MNRSSIVRVKWLCIFVTLIGLMGCQVDALQKGRKPSADWSKGYPFNIETGGDYAYHVDSADNQARVVWPMQNDAAINDALYYQQMDSAGVVSAPVQIVATDGRLRQPRIEAQGDGVFSLFWIDRPDGAPVWSLMQVDFGRNGELLTDPQPLTNEPFNISSYRTTEQYIVFEDRETGSIFGFDWRAGSTAELLVEDGELPMISADDQTTHFAWVVEDALYYSELGDQPLEGQFLTRMETTINDSLESPNIVVTDDWVYIFWAIYRNTGLEAGTGYTAYLAFEKGEDRPMSYERIWITATEEPDHAAYSGTFPLSEFVLPPATATQTTRYILGSHAVAGAENDVALAVSARQQLRLNFEEQMAVAYFSDGDYIGYQWAGKTGNISQNGSLAYDGEGNLHLFWLEGATGSKLFYSTVDPVRRDAIDAVNKNDVINGTLNGGMDALVGILFFPLAMGWILPGGLLLLARQWNRDYEILDNWQPVAFVIVAFLLYLGTKYAFVPTMFKYAPFTAWFDLGSVTTNIMRIGVPIISTLIAFVVAERRRRRNTAMSPLSYFLIAAGVDAFITLALYGVNFLGVF